MSTIHMFVPIGYVDFKVFNTLLAGTHILTPYNILVLYI